jgi:hypothetical protein
MYYLSNSFYLKVKTQGTARTASCQSSVCVDERSASMEQAGRQVSGGAVLECGDIGGRRRRCTHVPHSAATIDASFTHFPSSTVKLSQPRARHLLDARTTSHLAHPPSIYSPTSK